MEQVISKTQLQQTSEINFSSVVKKGIALNLNKRLSSFTQALQNQVGGEEHLYFRIIDSATDREVRITDKNGVKNKMLMFGSNNYLGLANHPYVIEKVKKAIKKFGLGVAGPPLLNGYTRLMAELESRLSLLKGTEETMIFSSGYNANLGLIKGLCSKNDLIVADEYNHASFFDGVKLAKTKCITFKHNNTAELNNILKTNSAQRDTYVAVEGVYSMDGDLAPLPEIVELANKYKAHVLLDDAHGTGVLGFNGEGTLDELGLNWNNEIILGTFSKTFAVNGGFVTGSKELINYLRFMARSYMFSASLPPVTVAAVLAGLDVMENEPWRRIQLKNNIRFLFKKLEKYGLETIPKAGIIALNIPENYNIRKMANQFHQAKIFVNAIEYPAVPKNKERFRISVSANHTENDLLKLVTTVEEIWTNKSNQIV